MKKDLDAIMLDNNLDALLVTGPAQHNPPMYYLTGGAHLTQADLIKKRGQEPILFFASMEREEAAATGLRSKNIDDYKLTDLLKITAGDIFKATIERYQMMLAEARVTSGRMAIYGHIDAGTSYAIFNALQERMPELEIVGEHNNSVLLEAMATKDENEIERIRKMGRVTTEVVANVADYLTSQRVKDDMLVDQDGLPLTIGDVKRRINLWLAERGAENPEGTIFAIGRDAGIPHSSGNPESSLRLGQTIVFDIFPCEAGSGYYYDFTRTWCLGYAPDEVQALYEDVLAVYKQIFAELKAGAPCADYQKRTCQLFEQQGHPTVQSNPQTQAGYVHSLGHGLGLHVHERPWFGKNATEKDILAPGVVVTIEPGLYYPDKGMGVRLEDSVWVRPDGKLEILAEYPLDLVLPLR
ncbi:MAG: Xaa-Pro peptidase family protein [Anaerolineales bacterium]